MFPKHAERSTGSAAAPATLETLVALGTTRSHAQPPLCQESQHAELAIRHSTRLQPSVWASLTPTSQRTPVTRPARLPAPASCPTPPRPLCQGQKALSLRVADSRLCHSQNHYSDHPDANPRDTICLSDPFCLHLWSTAHQAESSEMT